MRNFVGIVFWCLLPLVLAKGGGSSDFLTSIWSLLGIGAFTALIGGLLSYACMMDIKHWRKSIDADAQLEYPPPSITEYQLPPLHRDTEKLKTAESPSTKKTDSVLERADEKTMRIVRAMYTSSNRDLPPAVQRGTRASNAHGKPPLPTVSEKENEKSSQRSSENSCKSKK